MNRTPKITMLAAELTPIAKVGGLGDVVGALPKELVKVGAEVNVFLPFYGSIDTKKYPVKRILKNISISIDGKKEKIELWRTFLPGTNIFIFLVKHKYFSGKEIYAGGLKMKKGKYDNKVSDIRRFAFFSKAVLSALRALKYRPDVIHCHDWHTALLPVLMKKDLKKNKFFARTKTIYTIHNLANQGLSSPEIVKLLDLDPDVAIIRDDIKNGDINFMVEGILGADMINTVSPTYAKEILTRAGGNGLDKVLQKRKKDLYGILNGIDVDIFNPAKDKFIKFNYSLKNLDDKKKNKLALQAELGLRTGEKIALVGMTTRFVWQKGIELITEKIGRLNCQFVFLGTGEKKYEYYLKKLAKKYPTKIKTLIKFDAGLAQRIYAGSDIFLVPSRFEPCGLTQMIAMNYASVPVARLTGGLADTVKKDVGFGFSGFKPATFYATLKKAVSTYYNQPNFWLKLQKNGLKKDFSWRLSAKEYIKLYRKLIKN